MCEYCRTIHDVDGAVIPRSPESLPLISETKDIHVEASILVNTLYISVDACDDDGEVMPWKSYVTPISYCPMCGRKLDGGK